MVLEYDRKGALSLNDPTSFSNPESIYPDSFHVSWNVNFEVKKLSGSIKYHLIRSNPSVSEVIFDVRELHIKSINLEDGSELCYSIGEAVKTFGQPLTVKLPNTYWSDMIILINYETTSKSTALQWLSNEQTAGKQHPYLFSKCSAIHARSLFPSQDTPSVKATYTAQVFAPSELTVLMGALKSVNDAGDFFSGTNNTLKEHNFIQKIPIPSYLMAIVVGKLEKKQIGPRTSVWAEIELLESAAHEFEDTNQMLVIAEELLGEYVWGTLDLLVLPPSFPSGGMENPCLTFVTPTIIAGDKSLTNVLAHEIAHSWTGNLVTNTTFEHFWLNEGITVYVERLILRLLHGEQFRQFSAIGGLKTLKATVNSMGQKNPLTALVPNLSDVDPMNSFTLVPYEKGFLFLYYLEKKVGGVEPFVIFLKEYIWKNAYKSIDSSKFQEMFITHFKTAGKGELIEDTDWNTWLYSPGLPLFDPQYDHSLAEPCTSLKNQWLNWNPTLTKSCPFLSSDLNKFSLRSNQTQEFLAQILETQCSLGLVKVTAMDAAYGLSKIQNSEIKFLWITLCIRERSLHILPLALQFISEQGRMKFTRAIYQTLYAWEEVRQSVIENFIKNHPNMMPNSANIIAKDLELAIAT